MLPAVLIVPASSGVSAREANEEILNLIHKRVVEIAREIDTTANGLRALASRFATPNQLTDHDILTELRNLDASLERLLSLRTSLGMRLTAYQQQRTATQHPEADDPFADITPALKAS
jgi:prefoldin subunit 5